MGRVKSLLIRNYRSIEGPIRINFPEEQPLVLLGENNVGKSNIIRALDLVLGGFWPGYHEPEEHEYYDRSSRLIQIKVEFHAYDLLGRGYESVTWQHDPGPGREGTTFKGGYPNGQSGNVSNADRDTCYCVVAKAEDDLNYQLSYKSQFTLLSKIMHRFHRDLIGQQAVREELEALFERTKEQFYEIESFAEFSRALKQQLGDFLGSMTHQLQVDFEAYNPVNFFHALRLQPIQDGGVRAIEELGTGEQQILAIALAHAYANAFHAGVILVLEEPEAHLHPLAQSWLARRLRSLAEGGLQLIITTHSPHFVDLLNLEGLTLVRKTIEGSTYVIQKSAEDLVHHCIASGVSTERITEENVLPFYDAHATTGLKEGFFARAVVLVEGSTEALALPVLLRKCGIDCAREGIAILSVDGKGNLAKWNRLFRLYDIPAYLVFDNDARDDASGNHRRDALRSLAIGPEGQEELISATDWIVRDSVCVFGSNYEHIMRMNFGEYGELERQAQEERRLGSKPFIAKWVASRLNPTMEVGWDRLRHFSEVVSGLVS